MAAKRYQVAHVIRDHNNAEMVAETYVTTDDPAVDIWLNIDAFPRILYVNEVKS